MRALPEAMRLELAEVDELLSGAELRLKALKDLGEYEGLPARVVQRIQRKGTVLASTREQLAEIPEMVAGGSR